ncbi:MAG: heme exporter protein CcmD [Pseudomonadota bacterium]|jgi:heme exporter protein D
MRPQFHSLAEFVAMGGHGPYVWGVYGVAALVMVWLVARPLRRRARTLAELRTARDRAGNR